jgi:hypothetical protein
MIYCGLSVVVTIQNSLNNFSLAKYFRPVFGLVYNPINFTISGGSRAEAKIS